MSDVFRSCASAVVLRSSARAHEGVDVLLVHKPRKNDAWQLPQGGVEDGETFAEAAVRELQEEAGLQSAVIQESEIEYQYTFPASYRRFRPDSVCGQTIRFVHVALQPEQQSVIVDNNEIDDYAWVPQEYLGEYLPRKEYRAIVEQCIREFSA